MRRFSRNQLGLSEIVGTLMLVLIVVSAALAFGAFVQTEEKANLAYRAQEQQRDREADNTTSLQVLPNASIPQNVFALNFTVANTGTSTSTITSISINGIPLREFLVYNLSAGSPTPTRVGSFTTSLASFALYAGEEVRVAVNATNTSRGSFVYANATPPFLVSHYVQISVDTSLDNVFVRTFVPPVAFGLLNSVPYTNATGTQQELIFDGAESHALNDTVVAWEWQGFNVSVTGTISGSPVPGSTVFGEEVPVPITSLLCHNSYEVKLNVTDTAGLVNSMEFPLDYACTT